MPRDRTATPWTRGDIESALVIDQADVARALALVAEADPELREMLEAEEQEL